MLPACTHLLRWTGNQRQDVRSRLHSNAQDIVTGINMASNTLAASDKICIQATMKTLKQEMIEFGLDVIKIDF